MPHVRTMSFDPAIDPIHAAIKRHCAAILAYLDAPSLITNDDLDAATDALVATPCASRFGALALLGHLRGWIDANADFAAGHQPAYSLAKARVLDLALFLGSDVPPVAIPHAFPSGCLPPAPARLLPGVDRYSQHAALALPNEPVPSKCDAWEAVAAVRPDTAFACGRRFIGMAGELLTAVAIIGGCCVLAGLATLI